MENAACSRTLALGIVAHLAGKEFAAFGAAYLAEPKNCILACRDIVGRIGAAVKRLFSDIARVHRQCAHQFFA